MITVVMSYHNVNFIFIAKCSNAIFYIKVWYLDILDIHAPYAKKILTANIGSCKGTTVLFWLFVTKKEAFVSFRTRDFRQHDSILAIIQFNGSNWES